MPKREILLYIEDALEAVVWDISTNELASLKNNLIEFKTLKP
jgi:hypothetical protein